MTKFISRFGFSPQEHHISALPSSVAGIVILAITMFNGIVVWPQNQLNSTLLLFIGILGILYLSIFELFIIPSPTFGPIYGWINAALSTIGFCVLTYIIPLQLELYIGVLLILAVITSSIISERGPSYLLILLTTAGIVFIRRDIIMNLQEWTFHLSIAIIAAIIVETIRQLKNVSRNHIRRLETITDFSRNISSTLNTKQVMALLNAAFQNSVEADTYFVGLREGSEMRLELIYDDGEYYENQSVQLKDSLSGWVFDHRQSLFLPDLRKEMHMPGVRKVLVGKHKANLSWMGVPMKSEKVDGIIAIGSYRPNAFDRADLELLSNLAQHAALALHNTYRHEEVELRAQLDSLTEVYNHGHFLKLLNDQAEQASEKRPLSLIMLDVDFFKQYNDTYGHLVGDEVLTTLCWTIKQHVKNTDTVGRWGGEEFAISLPGADTTQALQIAVRIRQTMSTLTVRGPDQKTIPVPTISQGIAFFPNERDDVIKLIDLADQRLYLAKERGRNQIEPDPAEYEKVSSNKSI